MSKTHSLTGDTTQEISPGESGKSSLAEMERRFAIHMNALQEHANRARGNQASSSAGHSAMPPELARIRERLDRLSRKIGDNAAARGDDDQNRKDAATPEQIARLSEDLHAMREAMERVEARSGEPDLTPVTRVIQKNYADIARMLEQAQNGAGAADDGSRLDTIADRLDALERSVSTVTAKGEAASSASVAAIETRLDELASAILSLTDGALGDAGNTQKVAERISELAGAVEELVELGKARSAEPEKPLPEPLQDLPNLLHRLDEKLSKVGDSLAAYAKNAGGEHREEISHLMQKLSARVEEISETGSADISVRFAELDSQLGKIVSQLESVSPAGADLGSVCERLDSIDRQLTLSRDVAIDVATQAAEQAVQMAAASDEGGGTTALIAEQLQKLSDGRQEEAQRHQSDFDVLQKTLIAVAERLDLIDDAIREIASVGVLSPSQTASESDLAAPIVATETQGEAVKGAAFPEQHELPADDPPVLAPPPAIDDEPLSDQEPPIDLAYTDVDDDEMTDGEAGVPLEPGSEAPDLSALVRHASERRMAVKAERRDREDNAADYLAAARRAAQAAAEAAALSELEAAEDEERLKRPRRLEAAFGMLTQHKKAIVLAASAVVVAAVAIPAALHFAGTQELSRAEQQTAAVEDSSSSDDVAATVAPAMSAAQQGDPASPATAPVTRRSASATAQSGAAVPAMAAGDASAPQAKQAGTDAAKPADMPAAPEADSPSSAAEVAAVPMKVVPSPPEQVGNVALRQAAANGDAGALFEIGRRYTDGDGVERNLAEAAKWYELAAERGFVPAQYRYANFLEKGHGLSVDLTKSAVWYEKAAQNGNALAMHNLAVLLTSGLLKDGVQLGNAIDWFTRAAERGIMDSQVNLGIIYAKGLGTDKNLVESYKWFAIAAREGDSDAAQKRDTIAAALAPDQLETARGQAEIWKSLPIDAEANAPEAPKEWQSDSDEKAGLNGAGFVATAQQMLALRGFNPGSADGIAGERTRNAVIRFQLENGMEADGNISEELVRRLAGGSA